MDGNRHHNRGSLSNGEHGEIISIEQLQRLVRLLDRSDVSEIELRRAEEGMRLVLRKAKMPENSEHYVTDQGITGVAPPPETKHSIVAPLVGIFHTWAKPKGKALVAVGDHVKVGQLIATIQSLNVINDVESFVTGRVTEILVQDGQAVEYGQHLMTVDSSEGA